MKKVRLNRAVAGLLAASLAAAVMLPGMSVFAEESNKVDLTGGIFTDSGSYAGYEGKTPLTAISTPSGPPRALGAAGWSPSCLRPQRLTRLSCMRRRALTTETASPE